MLILFLQHLIKPMTICTEVGRSLDILIKMQIELLKGKYKMRHIPTLRVGIASYEEIKERTLSIARGEYKPLPSEPKIWFSSMESLAQVLSTRNKLLLELIAQAKPQSITELAQLSGRQMSNLSRTLKTMEHYGLVKLNRKKSGEIRPQVTFDHLRVDLTLSSEQRIHH